MLAWRRNRARDHDPRLTESLTQEANRLLTGGSWAEAEPVLRQVIHLRTEQLGATAQSTLSARSGLAWALIELRRLEEAVAELRGLLPLALTSWGERHETSNGVRLHMGRALLASGRPAQAEELARIILTVYPARDGLRLQASNLRARALGSLGRHREAADEHTALLTAATAIHGQDARLLLSVRVDRLQHLALLGEHDLVEQEHHALLVALPDEDPLRGAVSGAQAFAVNSTGRHEEAEAIVRAALAHRADTTPFLGLALSLKGQGRHEEALQVLTDTAAAYLQDRDNEYTSLLHTLTAQTLLGLNRPDEAELQARQAVEAAKAHQGPSHHRSLEAATTLGSVLAAQQHHTEAREHLTRCATAWHQHFGPHHPHTIATETELAALPQP
ncbi:hypothetical protein GCM10009665_57420 [Kitasatospora nipponensis]|uniref:Tetratricopeptide repeat protein n=1 Tax=Kitasatospora nipponensis TaxID=258049 RepID=A0ABN1WTH3_9ACTN